MKQLNQLLCLILLATAVSGLNGELNAMKSPFTMKSKGQLSVAQMLEILAEAKASSKPEQPTFDDLLNALDAIVEPEEAENFVSGETTTVIEQDVVVQDIVPEIQQLSQVSDEGEAAPVVEERTSSQTTRNIYTDNNSVLQGIEKLMLEKDLRDDQDIYENDRKRLLDRLESVDASQDYDQLNSLIADYAILLRPSDFPEEKEENSSVSNDEEGLFGEEIVRSIFANAANDRSVAEKIADLERAVRNLDPQGFEKQDNDDNEVIVVPEQNQTNVVNDDDTQVSAEDAVQFATETKSEDTTESSGNTETKNSEETQVDDQEQSINLQDEDLSEVEDLWHKPLALDNNQTVEESSKNVAAESPYAVLCLERARNLSSSLFSSSKLKEIALLESLCLTNMLTIGQKRWFVSRRIIKGPYANIQSRCMILNQAIDELLTYVSGEQVCEFDELGLKNSDKLFVKYLDKADQAHLNWSSKSMKYSVLRAILYVDNITEQQRADLFQIFNSRVLQNPEGSFYAVCDEIGSCVDELRNAKRLSNTPHSSRSQEYIDKRDLNVVGRLVAKVTRTAKKVVSSVWGGLTSWW